MHLKICHKDRAHVKVTLKKDKIIQEILGGDEYVFVVRALWMCPYVQTYQDVRIRCV